MCIISFKTVVRAKRGGGGGGGGHRYSWILLDTLGYRFFGILGKFLGSKYPSIQKKTCFYAKLPDTWDS